MKTAILILILLAGACGDIDSKLVELTREQKQCVNQCYDLGECLGDRPDPCADFCLSEGGPDLIATALDDCQQ